MKFGNSRLSQLSLLILAILPSSFFAAVPRLPTATKVWTTDVSHSVVLLHFSSVGDWKFLRIRYVEQPGSCTAGKGGHLELTLYNGQFRLNDDMSQPVGGLAPQTEYEMCPELSIDSKTWYLGASVKVTTLPLPPLHPAVPIPPKRFDTNYPNTAGYESVNVSRGCHDLMSRLSTALHQQVQKGTIINIPAGTVCTGNYWLSQAAEDVVRFSSSAVNIENSTISLPRHGYSEGQGIIFGAWYGCLPGSNLSSHCGSEGAGPVVTGHLYFAHVVNGDTIQVFSGAPKASGGKLCKFSNAGSGTNLIVKWPRPLHWIIIRTATPDNEFDPEHVRIGPAWLPKMAVLRAPVNYTGVNYSNVLLNLGDQDGGVMSMNANIRFVGIEFTYSPSPEAHLTSDPAPHFLMVRTNDFNQDIVFDRCYFHGLTKPERTSRAFDWDGMNEAIVDSYMDGLEFYHPAYSGLTLNQIKPTEFTIDPGSYAWGSGSATLDKKVAVQLSGTSGPGSNEAFVYYSMAGELKISLPPGVSGVCSPGPCHVFTTSEKGNGVFAVGGRFPDKGTGQNFWIDPQFSTSSSCAQAESLFSGENTPPGTWTATGASNIGFLFKADTSGYICGVRYYRDSAEGGSHLASIYTADGKQLGSANFANETQSGWQKARLVNPVRIAAGQQYMATMNVNSGTFSSVRFFQNGTADAGHLHATAQYARGNNSCNFTDAWPKDFVDNDAAAPLGCIALENGQIQKLTNADAYGNQYDTEGCQCMLGGIGPGPYAFVNNYVEGSGNVWHHDDGGGTWSARGDYFYYRNRFYSPLSEMFGGPQSDGLKYGHRHQLEWKAGQRILLQGNVFDGGWVENTPYGEFIDFSSVSGDGIRDVDIKDNTFEHAATVMLSPTLMTGGNHKPAPPLRVRFQNNLVWDISGPKYCAHGAGFCTEQGGFGAILAGAQGAEDWIIDHNTIVGNTGSEPGFLWITETRMEGLSVTNNILYLSPGLGEGITADLNGLKNRNCKLLHGKAAADCAVENYEFSRNVLMGPEGRATIETYWPGLNNYVPEKPSDIKRIGSVSRDPYSVFEELRPNPEFCANCGNASAEWKFAGVNEDQFDSAQGRVKSVEVPASEISPTSVLVSFTAPDKQSCPIDYSKSDSSLINKFIRVEDPGNGRTRKIVLSGLSPNTVYHYRVNCAVEQPTGSFKTR